MCEVGLFVRELARLAICLRAHENMHVLLCLALSLEGACGRVADTVRTPQSDPLCLEVVSQRPGFGLQTGGFPQLSQTETGSLPLWKGWISGARAGGTLTGSTPAGLR